MLENFSAITCSVTVLPGPGRAGDETVTIGERRKQKELGLRVLRNQ